MSVRTLLIAGLCALATPVLADDARNPTGEELAAIEAVLRAAGYVSWEGIEFDDGVWEVDDARKADGSEHDVDLDATSLEIVDLDD
jgi:hypothetical protein